MDTDVGGRATSVASATSLEGFHATAGAERADRLARAFFDASGPGYVVMPGQFVDELTAQGVPLQVEYEREGMWVTSGRALWRRRETPTRFVVVSRQTAP